MAIRVAIVLAGALCLLSLAQLANSKSKEKEKFQFIVKGDVHCDYCRSTFVSNHSKPMPGAEVKMECRDDYEKGEKAKVTYRVTDIITNDKGRYEFIAEGDHRGEYCVVTLVKSSQKDCAEIVRDGLGRKPEAEVILTDSTYLPPTFRDAGSLTYSPKKKLPECDEGPNDTEIPDYTP
ncbi:UNVERIFIED_CONTAM: Major pollen allergen Lig v 1 [Sesamum latifolium]|uniref:Major pollen allergen Lig v 1 n=1 Tax=Sesamum latifolium TaxID=2727402 RepID=A0AAW2WLD2_9LAMI